MESLSVKRQEYGYALYAPSYDSTTHKDQQIYPVNLLVKTSADQAQHVLDSAKNTVLDYGFRIDSDKATLVLAFGSNEDASSFKSGVPESSVQFQLLESREEVNKYL